MKILQNSANIQNMHYFYITNIAYIKNMHYLCIRKKNRYYER